MISYETSDQNAFIYHLVLISIPIYHAAMFGTTYKIAMSFKQENFLSDGNYVDQNLC